jgi:hypothetical protein
MIGCASASLCIGGCSVKLQSTQRDCRTSVVGFGECGARAASHGGDSRRTAPSLCDKVRLGCVGNAGRRLRGLLDGGDQVEVDGHSGRVGVLDALLAHGAAESTAGRTAEGRDGRPPTDSKGSQCGPLQHCNCRSAIGMPRPRRLQHIFAPPKNDRRARPTGRVNRFRSPPQWALRSAVCCSALHCPLTIVAAACPHTGTIRRTSGHTPARAACGRLRCRPLPLPPGSKQWEPLRLGRRVRRRRRSRSGG